MCTSGNKTIVLTAYKFTAQSSALSQKMQIYLVKKLKHHQLMGSVC